MVDGHQLLHRAELGGVAAEDEQHRPSMTCYTRP